MLPVDLLLLSLGPQIRVHVGWVQSFLTVVSTTLPSTDEVFIMSTTNLYWSAILLES
jgi:hypothetical protein